MGRWAKGIGLVAGLGLWLSLSALAQEYEVKIHRSVKVGQTYRETATGNFKQRLTASVNGQSVQDNTDEFSIDYEAVVTVVEVDKNGEASKESHSVVKCETVRNGNRDMLLAPGTILLVTGMDAGTKFEAQGGTVAPNIAQALDVIISVEKDSETDDEMYGTSGKKKVGDTWPMNAEAMANNLRRHKAEAKKDNVNGTVTLAGVTKVGTVERLNVRGTIHLKNVGFPVQQGLRMVKQSATMTFEVKVPVDPALGRPGESSKLHMEFESQGRPNPNAPDVTFNLTLDKSFDRHRTFPQ